MGSTVNDVKVPLELILRMSSTTEIAVKSAERNADLAQDLIIKDTGRRRELWYYRWFLVSMMATMLAGVGFKFVSVTLPFT